MKKWLKRVGIGLISAGASFVIVSIMNKLLFGYDDWLYKSIMMSVPWLPITLLKGYLVEDKGWKSWRFMGTIAVTVLVATLFIAGVCLSLEDYWKHAWYMTFCFTYPTCMAPLQNNN